jgi:four helix bundle protein
MHPRSPIRSFKDLAEWQRAIELAVAVRDIIRSVPLPERYDFDQTRRAALSVSRNIAEGFGRDHLGDFLHHLSMSRGSVFEVESDLYALRALSLVPEQQLKPTIASAEKIGRMIASHARTLRSRLRGRSNRATFFDQRRAT